MRIFRRSILWIVPVVVIPLAALLIIQYRFLRALESKSVSAERNWLRESAERVAEDIDDYYRASASTALTFDRSCLCRADLLQAHFAKTAIPGARTFFVARFEDHIRYSYFSSQGVPKASVGENEEQAIKLATVTWHLAHEMNRPAPHPALLVDDHDGENRIVMRPVVNDFDRVLGVAGIVFDERLTREAMLDLGNASLKTHYPNDAPELRVRIYGRQMRDQQLHTQPLSFVFSDWRLGIKDLCSTPEQLAALSFKNNMMLGGGVMIVLFGAIGLAVQAASRQMKLSQMKSDFVSNVSHELRTPLASIRVFGEYMRLGRVTSDEKVREYGEYIEAESRRLTQLINNILDFSKIESAEKKYKMAGADIVELVYDTTCAFAMPLRDKGYEISFTAPAAFISPVTIDRDAIAQVLMNLLDNAVKYSNGDKRVAVAVSGDATSVHIAVTDHGIGIPAAEQKKIFEKFYRVGSGLVHNVKGSGLGLAIVAHVVKAHGGRVDVVSAPGEGSTFTIVLERSKPKETEAA
ncbi:MAG TPA: HAMP domain-containing sensor histidine kinase [Thermoanaerobaculia bacterium]|nr:HAMP domain-containing sensor histidine kinase [Thermoanaerobaculia bacterium]